MWGDGGVVQCVCDCQVVECIFSSGFFKTKEYMTDLMLSRVRAMMGAMSEDLVLGGGKLEYKQAPHIVT